MILARAVILLMQKLFFSLAGILGIGFLIGFHELGHFLFCKLFNIRTPSFSIGFGPRLIKKKIGETEFALSAIPLGGYVEIAGSAELGQGKQEEAHATDPQSFNQKPLYQKLLVMLGGILFNLAFAYGALTLLFMLGMPKSPLLYPFNTRPVVAEVVKASPAEEANILPGDQILAIDGQSIQDSHDAVPHIIETIKPLAGKRTSITIKRDGQTQEKPITIGGTDTGMMGIVFDIIEVPAYSIIESIKNAFRLTNNYIIMTAKAYKNIFVKKDVSNMGGPLAVMAVTMKGAGQGFGIYLLILAIISINLAVLNLLPLPILDGGQILFSLVEAIIRRPIPIKIKEYIHLASWLLILALLIYLSYNDLMKIITPYLEKLMIFFKLK
ncbi:MAG: M50 family metallopeptidase [Candidatus Dependentiae bacterium]